MAGRQPYGTAPTGPSLPPPHRRRRKCDFLRLCAAAEENIACTMLPLPIATDLEIETRDGVGSARVMAMPFIDPRKQLAKES